MLGFKSKKEKSTTVNKVAKELFLDLIDQQLTFQESLSVVDTLHQTLSKWGSDWLDGRYLNHIRKDLEENGKLK